MSLHRNESRMRLTRLDEMRHSADPAPPSVSPSGWNGTFGSSKILPCLPFLPNLRPEDGSAPLIEIRSHYPEAVNVTLAGMNPYALPTDNAEIVAVLEWGVGGSNAVAMVDFIHGASFNLIADFVRVSARQQVLNNIVFPPAGLRDVQVGAFAAPGHMLSTSTPQRTIANNNRIANSVGVTYNIPPFAKDMVLSCNPTNTQATVDFDFLPVPIGETYNAVAYPAGPFPIPNSNTWAILGGVPTAMWRITCAAAPAPALVAFRAVFHLAL